MDDKRKVKRHIVLLELSTPNGMRYKTYKGKATDQTKALANALEMAKKELGEPITCIKHRFV